MVSPDQSLLVVDNNISLSTQKVDSQGGPGSPITHVMKPL